MLIARDNWLLMAIQRSQLYLHSDHLLLLAITLTNAHCLRLLTPPGCIAHKCTPIIGSDYLLPLAPALTNAHCQRLFTPPGWSTKKYGDFVLRLAVTLTNAPWQ